MNITPQDTTIQPISDDQDLAKALAGVMPDEPEEAPSTTGLQFEETPNFPVIQLSDGDTPAPVAQPETPAATEVPEVNLPPLEVQTQEDITVAPVSNQPDSGLDSIKNKALDELRPLINRATLPAEEKFDTYLMLIRSTDDASLIGPAHEAAQAITDETRKAEALIDIIKEITYLTNKSA